MSYGNFFKILETATSGTPDLNERIFLQRYVPKISGDYPRLNQEQRNRLTETLLDFSNKDGIFNRVYINSLFFHFTQDRSYIKQALEDFVNLPMSACDYINDYYTLSNLKLNIPELSREKLVTSKLLREIYKRAVEAITVQFPVPASFRPNSSRVVVMVDQLLDRGHAPTNRALKFTQVLQEKFKKEVLLVNTCMHSALSSGFIARKNFPIVKPQLSSQSSQDVDGCTINFFQPDPPYLNDDTVQAVVDKVSEFAPAGIVVVGNQCALAEVFAKDCFTLCSPLHNDVIPETVNVGFHTHTLSALDSTQRDCLIEEDLEDRLLFQFEGPYDIPPKKAPVPRQELNLPEDRQIVIVVGNRLETEMDDSFLTMLEDVVRQTNAFVFFLGKYGAFDQIGENWPNLAQNSAIHRFHTDLMSVYESCDVYLAPKRVGGGSSAAYAMAAGLPILSLAHGDIKITAQHFPELKSYSEIGETAVEVLNNPEKMNEYRKFAEVGAAEMKDSEALVAEFLKHMDEFEGQSKV